MPGHRGSRYPKHLNIQFSAAEGFSQKQVKFEIHVRIVMHDAVQCSGS